MTTTGAGSVTVNLSDTDPALLPIPEAPAPFYNDARDRLNAVGRSDLVHAAIPVHIDDATPNLRVLDRRECVVTRTVRLGYPV